MRSSKLLENLEFHSPDPYAQPLYVDENGRILRFMLRAGQSIRQHSAPHSSFYIIVLQGAGMFAGEEGREELHGPGSLLIFAPGELHEIRAVDEDLVFIGFLQGVPGTPKGKVLGEVTREER